MSIPTTDQPATAEQLAHRRVIHAPAIERARAKWPAGLERVLAESRAAMDAEAAACSYFGCEDGARIELAVQYGRRP